MLNKFIYLLFLFFLNSCVNNSCISKIEIEKSQNIGFVKFGDTLIKKIPFKNISSNTLKIINIESSCGCTFVKLKDSIIESNCSSELTVILSPKTENKKIISESIVIEANTDPIFNVIYLNGKIEN
ncbi:DUF1573 domain-containing protein [Flavobacterium sp.]|uniref:DUF1573 domain-containing protein n=1 Tax=Flavobacterium sp. TaxID=239 RepID=UPI0035298CBC